ncbi:MAG: serine hydrolase [Saprospiraceae bacterium]|nr:serine hydrolase [Saprospiraceae bacterium]
MKSVLNVLLLVLSFQILSAQTFNLNLAAKLKVTLDSLVSIYPNTKGMSASVYCPDQGIWTGASGFSHSGQVITTDMQFGIASNSKLFTAVALLKLAENNIISLEDSLHEWLPDFDNIDHNVTIRQLLNHTSGISDMFSTKAQLDSINKNPNRNWTPEEVLSWIEPMQFTPGTNFFYSNTNYILAGMIAESATGFHISRIIRDSILTPLQLDSIFNDVKENEIGPIAHRWFGGIDYHDTSRVSLNTAGGPAGAIFSSSSEMAKWFQALMDGQILNATSLAQMTTFLKPGNYGLGIGLFSFFGNSCWGHGGITIGYKSRTIYDPCMKTFVCGLSNSNPSAVDGITALLYKVLVDYLPACSGIIQGATVVCQGQKSIVYTVPIIKNALSYVWTLPNGALGTSSTNSIVVNYGVTAVNGIISVKGVNSYGDGATSTLTITVNPLPIVTITANGSTTICQGTSITLTANDASSYLWNQGEKTKNILVSKAGNYFVTNTNEYGCKATSNITIINVINTPSMPDQITGKKLAVCANSSENYSVPIVNGVNYYWIPPTGATVTQGQGSNNIQVNFGGSFTNGNLAVVMYNTCGISPMRKLMINSIPSIPGNISGTPFPTCNSPIVYSIKKIEGAKAYIWSTNVNGAVITQNSSPEDTAASIVFPQFITGTVSVKATNDCGSGPSRTISINGSPASATNIFGNTSPCVGAKEYYYIAKISGASSYKWTVPNGSSILTDPNLNSIQVLIGNNAGDISVAGINSCGTGISKKISIIKPCQSLKSKSKSEYNLYAFPNPATNQIKVSFFGIEFGTGYLQLFDTRGSLLQSKHVFINKGENHHVFDLQNYSEGIYTFQLITHETNQTVRIVKE